jgi:uncharacterized protein YbjT (DUF2867 family)
MPKTALVFGATGLTGKDLTGLLLDDNRYERVKVFVRRSLLINNSKLIEIISDLKNPDLIAGEIRGDHLFCCLGTTIKKAGSRKNFEWADLELPSLIAGIAEKNGVEKFIVISSIGANSQSSNFYLRTKGKMEERIRGHKFMKTHILRPSMLLGQREEFRFGEEAGKIFMKLFSFMFSGSLAKYKGIRTVNVARAMISVANSDYPDVIIESGKIEQIAQKVPVSE